MSLVGQVSALATRIATEIKLKAPLPAAGDKVVFVTNRGNDANDGRTLKTAFATVQAAITALGGPGLIQLGYGTLATGNIVDVAQTSGITIRGVGGTTSGATPASALSYSGTAAQFIDARSSTGFVLQDVMVLYSNAAFAGRLIDLRDNGNGNSTFASIRDCYLGGGMGLRNADSLIDISNTHSIRLECVQFRGANYGLRAKNISTDTANAISLMECYFNDNTTAHILNPGDGWVITGCTWEALHGGAAGALKCEAGFVCNGVVVMGGWAGDVLSGSGGIQFDWTGNDIVMEGTLVGGNTGSTGVKFRNPPAAAPSGLTLAVRFDGPTTAIDFAGVAPENYDFSRSSFQANVGTQLTGGVFQKANFDTRDGQPILGLRNRSTVDGRVPLRFQGDRTSSYVWDLGIDLDGGNAKRFGLRDMTRAGTPWGWFVTALGSIILGGGTADLPLASTDGFVYIPTTAGKPTGVPTAVAGGVPMCMDRTNSKLYFYVGGSWKGVVVA